jgi:hypothetical protein
MSKEKNIEEIECNRFPVQGPFYGLPYQVHGTPTIDEKDDGGLEIGIDYTVLTQLSKADADRFEKCLLKYVTTLMVEMGKGIVNDA